MRKFLSKKSREGLSTVIGMIIVLIIMIAVLVPFSFLLFSVPSAQEMAQQNAQVSSSLADQQDHEVVVIQSSQQLATVDLDASNQPIYYGLVYDATHGYLYVLLLQNVTPSVPLNITTILGLTSKGWTPIEKGINLVVDAETATWHFAGHPAAEIQVGPGYKKVAIVTNYGNMIPVTPYNYITIPLTKKTAGIVYLDPNTVNVLQNPQLCGLSTSTPTPLSQLVSKYGNSLTLSGVVLGSRNAGSSPQGEFSLNAYYDGPMCAELSTLCFGSPEPFTFNGYMNGYWAIPNDDVISGQGSYTGCIQLIPQVGFLSYITNNITVNEGTFDIHLTGAGVVLNDFTGNITFSNGTTVPEKGWSGSINATDLTVIDGKGNKLVINDSYAPSTFGITAFTATVNGKIETSNGGEIEISNCMPLAFNYHTEGNGEFDGNFQITPYGSADGGFSTFEGNVNAQVTNIQVSFPNTVTVDFSTSSPQGYVTGISFLSLVETPLRVEFNFAVANPSNETLEIFYGYISVLQRYIFDFKGGTGSQSGSENACLAGIAKVDFPNTISIPPGGFVNQTIIVSIPMQLSFFGPQLENANSITNLNQGFFQPTYETMNFELYTDVGYLSSGNFLLPIQVPPTVTAQDA